MSHGEMRVPALPDNLMKPPACPDNKRGYINTTSDCCNFSAVSAYPKKPYSSYAADFQALHSRRDSTSTPAISRTHSTLRFEHFSSNNSLSEHSLLTDDSGFDSITDISIPKSHSPPHDFHQEQFHTLDASFNSRDHCGYSTEDDSAFDSETFSFQSPPAVGSRVYTDSQDQNQVN